MITVVADTIYFDGTMVGKIVVPTSTIRDDFTDTMMDEGLQPVVDHDVSLTCPKCDHEFEEEISI